MESFVPIRIYLNIYTHYNSTFEGNFMLKKLKNLFGNENERILKRYREVVETINT